MDGLGFRPGAAAMPRADSDSRFDVRDGLSATTTLTGIVADEVIPRLLVTCRASAAPRQPTPAHVDTLARLALSRDPTAAGAQVAALAQGGVRLDSLLHDLIAPAACRLGEYWHADSVDFVEVALAMTRLIGIVRGLGAEAERDVAPDAPLALITTPTVERHALGSLIVAQSFRGAGWRVREVPGASADELAAAVAAEPVHLLGLSVGSVGAVAGLAPLVARLRRSSRNRRLIVAVGGPAYRADPDALSAVGADFAAADGREAVVRAQDLLLSLRTTEIKP